MNTHDDERLEEQLRGLSPVRPPFSLDARVAQTLASAGESGGPLRRLGLAGLAVAASVLLAAAVWPLPWSGQGDGPGPDVAGPRAAVHTACTRLEENDNPLCIENVRTEFHHEGSLHFEGAAPVRIIRRTTWRRVWIVDDQNDYRIQMAVPNHELVLVSEAAD